jgi:O-acetyl-ADP-ribose deacetylase (regulator of RNase III)
MLKHQQFEFAILNLLITLYITVILEIENVTFKMAVYELVYISLQCDAIVNSTRGDLHLNQGAVSATILAAAGDNIQNECDEIMNRRGRKLSSTEVEMTKGYNLGCKYVLHGALISPWNEQV